MEGPSFVGAGSMRPSSRRRSPWESGSGYARPRSNLRNWSKAVATQGSQAFAPVSQRTDVDAELRRLREENRVLKMERDILKKAAAYFAKESE